MLRAIRHRLRAEEGFTLVELLVVVLIIGLLASIAIPAFLDQRKKSQDSSAKSLTRNAVQAMENCGADGNGSYAACDVTKLTTNDPSLTGEITLPVASTATTYTIRAVSDSANWFQISRNANGTYTRTCATAIRYGCQTGGVW